MAVPIESGERPGTDLPVRLDADPSGALFFSELCGRSFLVWYNSKKYQSMGATMTYSRRSMRLLAVLIALVGVLLVDLSTAVLSLGTTSTSEACAATPDLLSRAYSPMYLDGTLDVFSRSGPNLTQVATVQGLSKPGELVITGDGRKIYVNDWGTGTLRVINACTLKTIKLIDVGSLAISTYIPRSGTFDGRYLYVASVSSLGISVVDTDSDTVVRFYLIPGIVGAHLSPDGKRLYALTAVGVLTLDPQTGLPIAPPLLTGALVPTWATTTLDGAKLYLADTAGNGLTVVDTRTMKIVKTVYLPFGTSPIIVKITPDGREVWMASGASAEGIVVFSTLTDTIADIIPTHGMALYVSFSPDSTVAYVAEAGPGSNTNSAHLGLIYLVAAVVGLVHGDGDIRVFSTTSHEQLGPVVRSGPIPGDVATVQPGVVSGG
jgi:DNA-binding beta-propeller fold protein YncE